MQFHGFAFVEERRSCFVDVPPKKNDGICSCKKLGGGAGGGCFKDVLIIFHPRQRQGRFELILT